MKYTKLRSRKMLRRLDFIDSSRSWEAVKNNRAFTDYNNNQIDQSLLTTAADAALATHDYTNRSFAQAAEDRCFPCTYQGCIKVHLKNP